MLKVLVTGVNGFVGKHLARELAKQKCEVAGIGREQDANPEIKDIIGAWLTCDLANKAEVDRLDLTPYHAIISLAGLTNVGQSFSQSKLYSRINVAILANICQRLLDQKLSPRVIAVSTGAVYDTNQPVPFTERSVLIKQGSPYALSKLAMEKAALDFIGRGLKNCVIVRPFNHIGPGQDEGFLVPDLYKKIKISLRSGAPLKIGNLATRRDYTDVRDVVRAYTQLVVAEAESLTGLTYNVCSGTARSGNKILAELKKYIPCSENLELTTDPGLIRANDPEELVGSSELLRNDTGWKPEIPFEQTIADFVASKESDELEEAKH
jgi:GDP-4-dehydro-6-deoxy-D-mannose reductase